jgi:DNA ligase D, 3''-phosphoesterase domain
MGNDRGVDRLSRYRRKRDFARTPEPSGDGGSAAGGARRFVVQRHRARRLHYDLRFEIDGALASWAVPKGPTLDPGVRRAAVHVEDHPLEYGDFEGVIPAGQYGGGDVIVWDTGTWEPYKTSDPRRAVRDGELHAEVHGAKLRGRFVLVRTDDEKDNWLLLHKHDEHAVDGWDPEDHPKSVLTGRTNEQVKADPDRLWRSDAPAADASVALRATGADELAALDELGVSGTWHVFGRAVRVTDLDAPLFPAGGRGGPVRKRDLLRYAAQVAPVLLPLFQGRALALQRFPHGVRGAGSWQRTVPASAPDWLPRTDDGELLVTDPAALIWAANRAALEWHATTARVDRPDRPAFAVIALDASDDLLALARLYRTALQHLGVRGVPVLVGDGIEIRIPIARRTSAAKVGEWVAQLSRAVGMVAPELAPEVGTPDQPRTLLVPYSPIAAPGAPVCTPLDWDELDDAAFAPDRFTIRTIGDRLVGRGDLLRALLDHPQRLPAIE